MPTPISPAWEDALKRFERHLISAGRSGATIRQRVGNVRRFAAAVPVPPDRVDSARIIDYLGNARWLNSTRNAHRDALKIFFSEGAGITPTDPAKALKRNSVPTKDVLPVSRKEVLAAIAAAEPRERLMILLGAVVGLKAMEIASCNAQNLTEHEDGSYTLVAVSTNGKTRPVPVDADIAEAIIDAGPAFCFPGKVQGHLSPAYISRRVSAALPKHLTSERIHQAVKAGLLSLAHRDLAPFHTPRAIRILDVDTLVRNPAIDRHLTRIEQHLKSDPVLAIGSCKNLLETVFKVLLRALNEPYARAEKLPALFGKVTEALVEAGPADAREATRTTLRGLNGVVQSLGETRSRTDGRHGDVDDPEVEPRHARLIFNATVSVAEYVVDVWQSNAD